MFVRNCWYVIAWDHEVPCDGLFARKVLGEAIVLLRTADDRIVALRDRCPHRLAPLSQGRKEGDNVRCGYHGLLFDSTGRCLEIPGAETVPAKLRVQCYPVAVKNKWVFVWMGEEAKADPALLPDNFSCDDPGWDHVPGYLRIEAPQALVCDRLLDFSHLGMDEKTPGGATAIAPGPAEVEAVPRGIRVTRRVHGVAPPPAYRAVREIAGKVDRWFICDFVLPGTLLMHSGGRPVEDGEDDMRRAVRLHSCQTLTPETETSTHCFFQQARQVDDGDRSTSEALHRSLVLAFEAGRAVLTAQAGSIEADPAAPMTLLAMDAAAVRFRKLVADMVAVEGTWATAALPRSALGLAAARGPMDHLGGQQLRRDGTVERRAR